MSLTRSSLALSSSQQTEDAQIQLDDYKEKILALKEVIAEGGMDPDEIFTKAGFSSIDEKHSSQLSVNRSEN